MVGKDYDEEEGRIGGPWSVLPSARLLGGQDERHEQAGRVSPCQPFNCGPESYTLRSRVRTAGISSIDGSIHCGRSRQGMCRC